jgi:hypothetical protein
LADPLSLFLSTLWVSIGMYCVIVVVLYSLVTVFWLARLFREYEVSVRPLHPDGAGCLFHSPLCGA